MISLTSLCGAIRSSLIAQERERCEHDRKLAAKRHKQMLLEKEWQAELLRRKEAEEDADGSRAAARQQREAEREAEQLACLAAQIVRQTRRS